MHVMVAKEEKEVVETLHARTKNSIRYRHREKEQENHHQRRRTFYYPSPPRSLDIDALDTSISPQRNRQRDSLKQKSPSRKDLSSSTLVSPLPVARPHFCEAGRIQPPEDSMAWQQQYHSPGYIPHSKNILRSSSPSKNDTRRKLWSEDDKGNENINEQSKGNVDIRPHEVSSKVNVPQHGALSAYIARFRNAPATSRHTRAQIRFVSESPSSKNANDGIDLLSQKQQQVHQRKQRKEQQYEPSPSLKQHQHVLQDSTTCSSLALSPVESDTPTVKSDPEWRFMEASNDILLRKKSKEPSTAIPIESVCIALDEEAARLHEQAELLLAQSDRFESLVTPQPSPLTQQCRQPHQDAGLTVPQSKSIGHAWWERSGISETGSGDILERWRASRKKCPTSEKQSIPVMPVPVPVSVAPPPSHDVVPTVSPANVVPTMSTTTAVTLDATASIPTLVSPSQSQSLGQPELRLHTTTSPIISTPVPRSNVSVATSTPSDLYRSWDAALISPSENGINMEDESPSPLTRATQTTHVKALTSAIIGQRLFGDDEPSTRQRIYEETDQHDDALLLELQARVVSLTRQLEVVKKVIDITDN